MKTKYFILLFVGFAIITGVVVYAIGGTTRTIVLEKSQIETLASMNITKPTLSNISCSQLVCQSMLRQYIPSTMIKCYFEIKGDKATKICYNATINKTIMNTQITIKYNSAMTDEDISREMTKAIQKRLIEIADSQIEQSKSGTTNRGGEGDVVFEEVKQ